jgi:hypothetical protein
VITPRKLAIRIHRWMGVGCCVVFVMWFASGIVLMYCDYPLVHAEDRLARAAILDVSRIQLSPEQAFAKLEASEAPERVWIAMLDGRPVYRFGFGSDQVIVYADSGEVLGAVSRRQFFSHRDVNQLVQSNAFALGDTLGLLDQGSRKAQSHITSSHVFSLEFPAKSFPADSRESRTRPPPRPNASD